MKKFSFALLIFLVGAASLFAAKETIDLNYDAPSLDGAIVVDEQQYGSEKITFFSFTNYIDAPIHFKAYAHDPVSKEWKELDPVTLKGFGDHASAKSKEIKGFSKWRYFAFSNPDFEGFTYTAEKVTNATGNSLRVNIWNSKYPKEKLQQAGILKALIPYKVGSVTFAGGGAKKYIVVLNQSTKEVAPKIFGFNKDGFKWYEIIPATEVPIGKTETIHCSHDGTLDNFDFFALTETKGQVVTVSAKANKSNLEITIKDPAK